MGSGAHPKAPHFFVFKLEVIMKEGRSILELAQEIETQNEQKRDFVVDTRKLNFRTENRISRIELDGVGEFNTTEHTNSQIAERAGIPKKYFDRMKNDFTELLDYNVNYLWEHEPQKRMIRTLKDNARAYLSDRYRRLDNYELAHSILPVIKELGDDVKVVSSEITDKRMYWKMLFPKIEGEVRKGDVIQAGLVISNSEIGLGAFTVSHLLYRLICLNGMIGENSIRKYHVGRHTDGHDDISELFADDTLKADDQAFFLKVRDTVKSAINRDHFDHYLDKLRTAAEKKVEGNSIKVIEELSKREGFSSAEHEGVLKNYLHDGDSSLYGLANAITRTSQDVPDYDRATELEKIGGKLIEIDPKDWKTLSTKAA